MFLCFLTLLRSSISEFPRFLPVTPSITTQTCPFSQLRFIACRCLALTLNHCTDSHKHIKSRSSIIEVTERSSAVLNSVQHNIKVCRVFFFWYIKWWIWWIWPCCHLRTNISICHPTTRLYKNNQRASHYLISNVNKISTPIWKEFIYTIQWHSIYNTLNIWIYLYSLVVNGELM